MRPVPSARLQLNGAVATPAPLAAADSSTAEIQLIPSLFLSFFLSFIYTFIYIQYRPGFVFLNNIFFHLFIIYILYLFIFFFVVGCCCITAGSGNNVGISKPVSH